MVDEQDTGRTPNHKLRNARLQRGWTHKDVADMIGLPDSPTVGRWERDGTIPRAHYCRELCRIFGMSLEDLGLVRLPGNVQKKQFWSIPSPLMPLVGRETEIIAVQQMLQQKEVRLVTLVGTGGVGKTRLSLEIVPGLRSYFTDGACFVSLATVQDPSFVMQAIANELAIRPPEKSQVATAVHTFLQDRTFLLVLDNFEHVVTAAPCITDLLTACPGLKILVTSRATLPLPFVYDYSVPPLAVPDSHVNLELADLLQYDSVALFVERVRAIYSKFRVNTDTIHLIVDICKRLEGLPLAIELAAPRVKLLSLSSLLEMLSSPLAVLESNLQTIPDRHRALLNTIKWSYNLLDEQEKRLLRWLSAFQGGFSLEAVERLGEALNFTKAEVLALIESLFNNSLITRDDDAEIYARYSMLETIREYSLQCLKDSGESALCYRTHALYFLDIAERAMPHLTRAEQPYWLAYLDRDVDNLRIALRWCIDQQEVELALRFGDAFGKFCGLRGFWNEEHNLLDEILALPATGPALMRLRARVLRRAGHLAYRLRNLKRAHLLFEESKMLSLDLDDKSTLAGALVGLGWTLYRQKDVKTALTLLQRSVDVAHETGDSWVLANALERLGTMLYSLESVEDARRLLRESISLTKNSQDKESLARILNVMVEIELEQGAYASAAALAHECHACAEALSSKPLISMAQEKLAEVALFQNELPRAAELFQKSITLAQDLGDRSAIMKMHLRLAEVSLLQHPDPDQILPDILAVLDFFRTQGDHPNITRSLCILAEAQHQQQDFVSALQSYKEAIILAGELSNKKRVDRCIIGMVQVLEKQNKPELAALLEGYAGNLTARVKLYPTQQASYQQALQRISARLGEERWLSFQAQGQTLSVEQIVASLP